MKRVLAIITVVTVIISCNNKESADSAVVTGYTNDLTTLSLPYAVDYNDLKLHDPANIRIVLDFFKKWDENKLAEGRSLLADSVIANFPDGYRFEGLADSLIAMGEKIRSGYSSVSSTIDAAMSVRSEKKDENWVLIWSRSYVTDNAGKADSSGSHSYWMIKDNKITYWGEQESKLSPQN